MNSVKARAHDPRSQPARLAARRDSLSLPGQPTLEESLHGRRESSSSVGSGSALDRFSLSRVGIDDVRKGTESDLVLDRHRKLSDQVASVGRYDRRAKDLIRSFSDIDLDETLFLPIGHRAIRFGDRDLIGVDRNTRIDRIVLVLPPTSLGWRTRAIPPARRGRMTYLWWPTNLSLIRPPAWARPGG